MGVTIDDQQLLLALQQLKDSPTYDAKGMFLSFKNLLDLSLKFFVICSCNILAT